MQKLHKTLKIGFGACGLSLRSSSQITRVVACPRGTVLETVTVRRGTFRRTEPHSVKLGTHG